jgi:hypothetical protein
VVELSPWGAAFGHSQCARAITKLSMDPFRDQVIADRFGSGLAGQTCAIKMPKSLPENAAKRLLVRVD